MTFNVQNGYTHSTDNGRFLPFNNSTWDDLTTWNSFISWIPDPVSTLYVNIGFIDLGSIRTFNLLTNLNARGVAHYYIMYNNTGNFDLATPNYTEVHITNGQTNIPPITAQYLYLTVALDNDSTLGFPYFDNISWNPTTTENTLTYSNVNSTSLPGTISDREFTIDTSIGSIRNVQITSHGPATAYNVDLYVSKYTTSTKTFPDIISKSGSTVHLQFIGIDGEPRESIFDIQISTGAEWYMDAVTGNLLER